MKRCQSRRMIFGLTSILTIAGADQAALAQQAPVAFQERAADANEFDCVIEPKMTIKLGSPDTGIISELMVDRNSRVKRGQVVARLDSELQRIAVDLARVKAGNDLDLKSERARLRYRAAEESRQMELQKREYASAKSRDEAVTEKELAELALGKADLEHQMSRLELQQAEARLERRSIRSPVDGVVSDMTIKLGEYVYDQTPLMVIAQVDPLYVKAFLPVRLYRRIQKVADAEVFPEEPIGGDYKARIKDIDQVFDAASSTFNVRLELPNPDYELPAGLRCKIRFNVSTGAATNGAAGDAKSK